tara:strand:+ start:6724 stop:7353 length:630 start_codon:yes stop_codon:yes gene_type:complete
MKVKKFTNTILSSNTYLIYKEEENEVWLIDPGDSVVIINWIKANNKTVKGILLTHYHIDHIYGVNDFHEKFNDLKIYASRYTIEGLFSAKLNGSYYMEIPYEVTCKEIQIVDDNFEIGLFDSNQKANIIYTPGHNNDCISFGIDKYLFTGDALIPGVRVHTRSKQGDKLVAQESINRIFKQYSGDTIICPGHGEMTLLKEIKIKTKINV